MNSENKPRRRSPTLRIVMRIAGPLIVLVGIGLIAFSAMSFASTVGTEQNSKLNPIKGRSLRAPKYGWCRWAGMALIAAGVVVSSVGFELFAKRDPESRQPKPARRKIQGQPLGQLGKKSAANRPDVRRQKDG